MRNQNKQIFILHGWTYKTQKWINFLSALNKGGLKTTLLKIPGLTAELNEAWALKDYVTWLEKQLSGKNKINLLAHSFGARIALKFTAKHPEKVNRLILISAAGIKDKSLRANLKRGLFLVIAKIGRNITSSENIRKSFYKLTRERDYLEAQSHTKETMKNVIKEDLSITLEKIRTPTCIIWGKKDKITPVKNAYYIQTNIKNSKLVIINNAKHSPHYSHPKKVAEFVRDFIA